MEKLTGIKTFRGIVDWVQTMMNSNIQDPSPPVNKTNGARGGIEEVAKIASEIRETSQQTEVPRFTIANSEAPLNSGFPPLAGVFLVTNDGAGLAEAVVEKLQGSGALPVLLEVAGDYASVKNQVERARQEKGSIRGLIHLAPLKKGKSFEETNLHEWREKISLEVKSLFYLASAAGADLQACNNTQDRAYVIAAVNLYSGTGRMMSPSHGGVSGLVKTLAVEWPEVRCRVVDLEPNPDKATLTDLLLREMGSQDKEVEVSYRDYRRYVLRAKTAPWVDSASGPGIDSDSVVLITGGARGITAEIACELAVRYRPHLVLVGRSSPPESEESPETIGLSSPPELKRALVEQRRRVGGGVTLAEIEAAYQRLVRDREMRRTFAAIRESGASLSYYSVDVRDEKAFGRVLQEIYETQGRIDAVLHGAGIIEDKLLVDKAPDSFDRVFDTKADSAFILTRNLRAESLKVFFFF
jgi:NAD(P)-dependent dehydrogenase (short-subunit alcohol dehydrogenase family)